METGFRIFDASLTAQRNEWIKLWQSWPEREIQAHPGFGQLFARGSDRAMAATYASESGARILYPFVVREIDSFPGVKGYRDITIPFGYGGPARWGTAPTAAQTQAFWQSLDDWLRAESVVSEFVGFGLSDSFNVEYPGERVLAKQHIVVDLNRSFEELWASFDRKVRKNVNRATREGLTVSSDEVGTDFAMFYSIFLATMERRSASEEFFFPEEFFTSIHRDLSGQFVYFYAFFEGNPVSVELVLVSADSVYSFLGGTLSEFFPYRPNDLLKVEIMKWAQANGKRHFVLGGGFTPGDGIERYKRTFAPNGQRDFHIGRRVLNRQAYDQLVAAHTDQRTVSEASEGAGSFFPEYRTS